MIMNGNHHDFFTMKLIDLQLAARITSCNDVFPLLSNYASLQSETNDNYHGIVCNMKNL